MPGADTTAPLALVQAVPGRSDRVELPDAHDGEAVPTSWRLMPVLATILAVLAAGGACWALWDGYVASPWTRDATVRVYVVTLASEVSGRITELDALDNQFVHRGDVLMVIDPANYAIAVASAQAKVDQTQADMVNKQFMARRRQELTTLSTSVEDKQSYTATALIAEAAYHQAIASLAQAKVNLERTRVVSPVNGWVTNLQAQVGDYTVVGQKNISVVNADSFWIDAYFEETHLDAIHDGDPARVTLMGTNLALKGHVQGVARGINVSNAQSDSSGLALVNPVFTWVQLAQRVPVRIHIDGLPEGVRLVAGRTATVAIRPHG